MPASSTAAPSSESGRSAAPKGPGAAPGAAPSAAAAALPAGASTAAAASALPAEVPGAGTLLAPAAAVPSALAAAAATSPDAAGCSAPPSGCLLPAAWLLSAACTELAAGLTASGSGPGACAGLTGKSVAASPAPSARAPPVALRSRGLQRWVACRHRFRPEPQAACCQQRWVGLTQLWSAVPPAEQRLTTRTGRTAACGTAVCMPADPQNMLSRCSSYLNLNTSKRWRAPASQAHMSTTTMRSQVKINCSEANLKSRTEELQQVCSSTNTRAAPLLYYTSIAPNNSPACKKTRLRSTPTAGQNQADKLSKIRSAPWPMTLGYVIGKLDGVDPLI